MSKLKNNVTKQGIVFTLITFSGNILNLIFNFYLGKVLAVDNFSLIALYLGILYCIGIFFNAFNFTVIHTISSVFDELKNIYVKEIIDKWSKNALIIGFTIATIWILLTPYSSTIFNVQEKEMYPFSIIFILGNLIFINRGVLISKFKFINAAIVFLSESFTKLLFATILILIGLSQYTYVSIPISILIAFIISRYFIAKVYTNSESSDKSTYNSKKLVFPTRFYLSSLMLGVSTLTFLSIDVILAKAFFPPSSAGAYAILALTGKIIFLFSSILGSMFIPYFSSTEDNMTSKINIFRLFLTTTSIILFTGSLFFIFFGPNLFILFFGEKILPVSGYFTQYILSVMAFSLSYALVLYHQSKRQYIFSIISSTSLILLIVGTIIFHNTLSQFLNIFTIVSAINFITILVCHMYFKINMNASNREITEVYNEENFIVSDSKRVKTITIGIPAFNEEANIRRILNSIIKQSEHNYIIEKIIVSSDGSQDKTVSIVNEFNDERILLLDNKKNRGLNYRHNQIMGLCNSDILVLLNADIALENEKVIYHLVEPLLKDEADFSAQWAKPVRARTFLESILNAGFELKYYIYSGLNEGNNIYTCVGHMRALSYAVYKTTTFPLQSEGEDQYLYLSCIARGFKYRHANKASAQFRLPSTWKDYKHYARRIFQTQRKHKNLIDEKLLRQERFIPRKLLIEGMVFSILRKPFQSIAYIIIHISMQKWSLLQAENLTASYQISETTKSLFLAEDG